jgi:hypothetical protein
MILSTFGYLYLQHCTFFETPFTYTLGKPLFLGHLKKSAMLQIEVAKSAQNHDFN